MKLVVAITGASGAIYGIELLKILRDFPQIETHLIISKSAAITIAHETQYKISEVKTLADHYYNIENIAACLASGSFKVDGMVIAPCSVKTMAAVAAGFCDNLITRTADVMLKERKKLVLMLRETPLNLIHIRNIALVTEAGGIIYPPVPAFYSNPKTIDELVNHSLYRVLDLFDIDVKDAKRWQGFSN